MKVPELKTPVTISLIGAGDRGTFAYGRYAINHRDKVRFAAVADPDRERRERFAAMHEIPASGCFESWQQLMQQNKLSDGVLVATQDQNHLEPAVAAMEAGYDVLLEKPMAVTPEDCLKLVHASERTGRILMVCHVLRYTGFFSTIKNIIQSGRLGEIVTVEHRENVSYWHMAHSFVRGNWRNSGLAAPMILAKCCHDLDILTWMLEGKRAMRLQSMGSLLHYRKEHAPAGAVDRCTNDCPAADSCEFYAPRFYLDMNNPSNLLLTISNDSSYEGRLHALQTGPYGRCVYHCDNDVVDHQVVNLEYDNGALATLVMHGHSHEEGRTMRYDGTKATLRGTFLHEKPHEIVVYDHLHNREEHIALPPVGEGGHGGGDGALFAAFVAALANGEGTVLASARNSLESHILAFASEKARTTGGTIDLDQFKSDLERQVLQQTMSATKQ